MYRSLIRKLCNAALAIGIVALLAASAVVNAQTKMPRINFRDRTLANGLRVLSVTDKSSPTVAINVWYHVGSKDDPAQRSGFAHLFEHIMFKSTKNMKAEMMDRLTEDVGGNNNAYTADDVTVYYEIVPSNYLETLLWAEAERLSGLTVDDADFHSERAVVEDDERARLARRLRDLGGAGEERIVVHRLLSHLHRADDAGRERAGERHAPRPGARGLREDQVDARRGDPRAPLGAGQRRRHVAASAGTDRSRTRSVPVRTGNESAGRAES